MSKRRYWLAGIPVICILAVARWGAESRQDERQDQAGAHPPRHGTAAESAGAPSKNPARSKRSTSTTHSPERLRQFFLQPVAVEGLPLSAALQKLKAAYEQACADTGETALDLKFHLPAGKDKVVRINPGVATLESSVQRLAMFAGMKVKREGITYVFEAPKETGKPLKKTVPVSSSVPVQLSKACHLITHDGSRDFTLDLRVVGLDLDPATRVIHFPVRATTSQTGELTFVQPGAEPKTDIVIEGTSAADELAISGYLAALQEPLIVPEHKLQVKMVELPAGSDWIMPDLAQYSSQEFRVMMRELTERQDASVMALPETATQEGEPVKIEVGARELIVPVEGTEDQFESHQLGIVMDFSSQVLGFGSRTNFSVTAKVMPENWSPGQPAVEKRVDLKDTAWARNGNSFLRVQERADGSRVVIILTSEMEMVPFRGFRLGL